MSSLCLKQATRYQPNMYWWYERKTWVYYLNFRRRCFISLHNLGLQLCLLVLNLLANLLLQIKYTTNKLIKTYVIGEQNELKMQSRKGRRSSELAPLDILLCTLLKDFRNSAAAAFLPSLSKILLRPGRTLVFQTLVIFLSFSCLFLQIKEEQSLLGPTQQETKEDFSFFLYQSKPPKKI